MITKQENYICLSCAQNTLARYNLNEIAAGAMPILVYSSSWTVNVYEIGIDGTRKPASATSWMAGAATLEPTAAWVNNSD